MLCCVLFDTTEIQSFECGLRVAAMLRVRVSGRYWPAPPPPPPFMVSVRRCRATAAPPATPPPAEFHCRHPVKGGCVARRPEQPSRVLLQVLTRVTGVGVPVVPTLLQHFTRAGQTAAQCQGPALGWAGWEEDGRQQDNSLFSGWIHPTFPSTHQNWGVAPL